MATRRRPAAVMDDGVSFPIETKPGRSMRGWISRDELELLGGLQVDEHADPDLMLLIFNFHRRKIEADARSMHGLRTLPERPRTRDPARH